jgi:hypothetical protein
LKPGDVIHLTKNGPAITFQPPDAGDDFLTFIPKFAEESARPLSSERKAGLNRDIPLHDTVDIAAPITSESLPTTTAPRSGTIPTTRAPLSGTIPTTRAPLSGAIPTAKTSLSGTMPTAKAPQSGTFAASKSNQAAAKAPQSGTVKSVKGSAVPKSSVSDQEIPVRKPKRSASQSHDGSEDQIDLDLPVLTRSSSWEEEELAPAPRRRGSSDKAEMDWIINMVIRCVIGGVILLVMWLVISTIWKALSQPGSGIPDVSGPATVDTNQAIPANVATSPPAQAIPRPIPKPSVAKNPDNKVNSAENQPAGQSETEPKEDESPEIEMSDGGVNIAEEPGEVKPAEPSDASTVPIVEKGELSPLIQATTESLYAIVMQDQAGQQIHLGTAWAVSEHHLVTSGTIGVKIKALMKKGYKATGVQPSIDWAISIKDARIHSKYVKATTDIANAVANRNEKLLAQDQAIQLRHNLAVLDVDPAHQLEKHIPIVVKPFKTTKETVYSMVGFPLAERDTKLSAAPSIGLLQECRSKRLSPTGASSAKEPPVNVKFAAQVTDRNWSGSPVMNKDDEVIGIYAQAPPFDAGKKDRIDQVVIWIGLLRDIAPEILKKTATIEE